VSENGRDSDPWATATSETGDPGEPHEAPDPPETRESHVPFDPRAPRDSREPGEIREIRDPYSTRGPGLRGTGPRPRNAKASDPIGDLQRWLVRNSAKRMGREIKGQFRSAVGGNNSKADVWEVATTEPPPTGEAPECAWCPICRAARRMRESGPGLASQVAGASDALLSVAQDTLSAVETTLSTRAARTDAEAEHRHAEPVAPPPQPTPTTAAAPAKDSRHAGLGWPGEGEAHTHHPAAPDGPDDRA
jgi:hypothetical protein